MIFKGLTSQEIKGLGIFLLIIFCIFLQGINGNTAGFYFDDGMYLIGSRGFAEGYGYVISNFLEIAPIIKYPPLFSMLMSPFWWISPHYPDNLFLLKLFNILISVSYIGALYLCFRKILNYSLTLSFILIGFIAMDYSLITVSTEIMSEPLYLLLSILTFISFQLYFNQINTQHPKTKKYFILTLILSILTFYTRTIGFTLIIAMTLTLLLHKKFKNAFLYGTMSLLLCLPWMIWTSYQQTTNPFFKIVFLNNQTYYSYHSSYFTFFQQQLLKFGSLWNLFTHDIHPFLYFLGIRFFPIPSPLLGRSHEAIQEMMGILILLILFIGIWKIFTLSQEERLKKNLAPGFYCFFYMIICLFWGDTYQFPRFITTLLPFLFIYIFSAFSLQNDDKPVLKKGIILILSFCCLINAFWVIRKISYSASPESIKAQQFIDKELQATFRYMDKIGKPQDRFYCDQASLFLLGTHQTILSSNPNTPMHEPYTEKNAMMDYKNVIQITKANYVIDGFSRSESISPMEEEHYQYFRSNALEKMLLQSPNEFILVYTSPQGGIKIFKKRTD